MLQFGWPTISQKWIIKCPPLQEREDLVVDVTLYYVAKTSYSCKGCSGISSKCICSFEDSEGSWIPERISCWEFQTKFPKESLQKFMKESMRKSWTVFLALTFRQIQFENNNGFYFLAGTHAHALSLVCYISQFTIMCQVRNYSMPNEIKDISFRKGSWTDRQFEKNNKHFKIAYLKGWAHKSFYLLVLPNFAEVLPWTQTKS